MTTKPQLTLYNSLAREKQAELLEAQKRHEAEVLAKARQKRWQQWLPRRSERKDIGEWRR